MVNCPRETLERLEMSLKDMDGGTFPKSKGTIDRANR